MRDKVKSCWTRLASWWKKPGWGRTITVGNPELANSAGGFSFPYVGLLENTQLRVVTVGKPEVASPRFNRVMRLRHPGLYRALIKVNDGAHVSNYSEPILIR
ncbi:MAG: hypothetical protein ABSB69_13380 [Solirubrobacteraceae bacterium]